MNKFIDKKTVLTLIIIILGITIFTLAFQTFFPINENNNDNNYSISDNSNYNNSNNDNSINNSSSGNPVNIPTNEELLDNLLKDNINLNTDDTATQEFIGTILEETSKYIIVKPNEDEKESKVADKIIVTFKEEHLENIYGVGTKVLIVYDGIIAESYPAQINEISISKIN